MPQAAVVASVEGSADCANRVVDHEQVDLNAAFVTFFASFDKLFDVI